MFHWTELTNFIVALLAISNPLGGIPIFLSLTGDRDDQSRRKIAHTVFLGYVITGIFSLVAGQQILHLFGIKIGEFQVAGGVIILLIALAMLNGKTSTIHHNPEAKAEAQDKANPGIVPLTIPLLAGPGTIATIIIWSHQIEPLWDSYLVLGLGILLVAVVIWVGLRFSEGLAKILKNTGMSVVTRLMGVLLAAIGVSLLGEGLRTFFISLIHNNG